MGRFMQFPNPIKDDKWEVYGNFPRHIIKGEHTSSGEKVYIINVFNENGHQRDEAELQRMAEMHQAYLDGDAVSLRVAADTAADEFGTLQRAAEVYREAAGRL